MGASEILVSGGVAALLAAIAGGGLKAFGVEVPLLASMQRQGMLLVVGVALIGLGLYSGQPRAGGAESASSQPPAPSGAPANTSTEAAPREAPPTAPAPAVSARPDIPNIVGLPFAAARQFLIQNSWAPINSASPPMANENLGLRGQEVFDAGYFEAVGCSGGSLAPCLFRYQHPGGHILEVVAVGEDLTQAIVNRAVILDCSAEPRPEGCDG